MSKLQLEVGKRYMNRNGGVRKIVGFHPKGFSGLNDKYKYSDEHGGLYKADGSYQPSGISRLDLIGEVFDAANNPSGIEAIVCADIASRQAKGIAKYGTTVAENPLELVEWLQHQYEELLDAAVYCRRAIEELKQ